MMSSSGSEEKTKANSVSELLNEYIANVNQTYSSLISIGCLFSGVKEYDDAAIIAFTKAIELDPGQMAAYGYRGDSYLKKNENDKAFQDLTRVIESNPEPKQLQDAYVRRSIVYQIKNENEKANADFSKSVEIGLRESEAYASRALVYRQKKDYEHALSDYTNAINIEQENPDLYIGRAWTYWGLIKGDDALQDFATALDLHLDKESVIEFLKGPLHEISNIFLPGEDDYDNFPSDFPLSTRLLELYNDIIGKYPDLPDGHLHRGIHYISINDYGNAVNDFSAFLRFNGDDVFIIFLQGVCYDKLNNRAQAREHFQRIAQRGTIDSIKKIKTELAKYPPLDSGIESNVFLSVIGEISSIEETLLALIIFFNLEKLLNKKDSHLSQELLSMAKYLDALHFNSDAAVDGQAKETIKAVFNNYPGYTGSPKAVLVQDGWHLFTINAKLSIMEYIVSQVNVFDLGEIYDAIPYEQVNGNFYRFHERDINQYRNLINTFIPFSKQLQYQLIEFKIKKQQEEDQARLDERNKVIADLSHSIKNLISTIIDPLENMNNDQEFRPEIIQNALKGANLVREIVNAMNLSFKSSLDDFKYDAAHNQGKGSTDLETLVIESLKYSVGNMFDSKYFSNFVHKYFPKREVFDEANAEWASISQRLNKQDLMAFLAKYFFNIEVSTGTAAQYILGNEKGSAIKMLILFQEMILNAVKYSAFVEKEVRFLNIDLTVNPGTISIHVANRFRENLATKTSGIGHIIIDNFARRLLEAQLDIRQVDNIYAVEIKFSNLWGKKNENLVRRG
jgi:tetratricopeptide (TPR) repeat protein